MKGLANHSLIAGVAVEISLVYRSNEDTATKRIGIHDYMYSSHSPPYLLIHKFI